MRILLIVAYFVPEIGSAAHTYYDLARALTMRGHEVHVITSYPRPYNTINRTGDTDALLHEESLGIYIHRVKHPSNRDNIIIRGIEHFILPHYYFNAYKKLNMKFDACLMYIPPLPLFYLAQKIKRYDGTPSVLNFQDFHPQELTDVGVLNNPLMIRLMSHIERRAYKDADYITVLSRGGIEYVVQRGADPDRVSHIYNGVLLEDFNSRSPERDFKETEGVKDKFLISYAGILSPFQGLEVVFDAAKELAGDPDIIFYIVGDGMVRDQLAERISSESIQNVRLLPLQPREEYYNIIESSDLSLVLLDSRMKAPCIPGKIINLLAVKQPIIAVVGIESETARFVEESGCGLVVRSGDTKALKDSILRIKNNSDCGRVFGEMGRDFLRQNMELQICSQKYEEIIGRLTEMDRSIGTKKP